MKTYMNIWRVIAVLLIVLLSSEARAQSGSTQYYTPNQANPSATQPVTPATPLPVTGTTAPKSFTALASTATLTVSGTAQNLPSIPTGALYAVLTVAGGPVAWRDDGTAPVAALAQTLPVGIYQYSGPLAAIQFILATGTGSATVTVAYYK